MIRTSVVPGGSFRVGVYQPEYEVVNLRQNDHTLHLGKFKDGTVLVNEANFVTGDVQVKSTKTIYEIRNPFPFRGCTYIDSSWAANRSKNLQSIRLSPSPRGSFVKTLGKHLSGETIDSIFQDLPRSLQLSVAQTSDDPEELILLAKMCCKIVFDVNGQPQGLEYTTNVNKPVASIGDFELFETVANNPYLPDAYKEVMVLRPGVQGKSEIVGDYVCADGEIFEYLRGNSYIPWGHFAANFAHNSIRYRIHDLSLQDMRGVRHLYYQRTFVVLAGKLGLASPVKGRQYSVTELEDLRLAIVAAVAKTVPEKIATLWGWNFGYDFSGSGYRLHASHQMIHQQYAMVPESVQTVNGEEYTAFSCGDMVADTVEQYHDAYGTDFFEDYLTAIRTNSRVDQGVGERSLVVWEDENVLLFVPKAQVSQWELQLMVTANVNQEPIGNIIEAGNAVRASLDKGLLIAQQTLAALGAELVTTIEFSKRLGERNGQRLLYSLLPKLPWSMGAFSEAQSRYICGHYPEDFASACRMAFVDFSRKL